MYTLGEKEGSREHKIGARGVRSWKEMDPATTRTPSPDPLSELRALALRRSRSRAAGRRRRQRRCRGRQPWEDRWSSCCNTSEILWRSRLAPRAPSLVCTLGDMRSLDQRCMCCRDAMRAHDRNVDASTPRAGNDETRTSEPQGGARSEGRGAGGGEGERALRCAARGEEESATLARLRLRLRPGAATSTP